VALSSSTLETQLRSLFLGPDFPRTPQDAADRWANAYLTYAGSAVAAPGGSPVGLSAPLFSSPLAGAFGANDPSTTAQAFGAAMLAFWTPVTWAGPAVGGATTLVGGAATLPVAVLGLMASLAASRATAAQAATTWANALHAATILTVVTYVLPLPASPVIAPIS
jgi:hypothetical protein